MSAAGAGRAGSAFEHDPAVLAQLPERGDVCIRRSGYAAGTLERAFEPDLPVTGRNWPCAPMAGSGEAARAP